MSRYMYARDCVLVIPQQTFPPSNNVSQQSVLHQGLWGYAGGKNPA